MRSRRRTRRAMQLSRGLILGRIWTTLRHVVLGWLTITLTMMSVTGHVYAAIGITIGIYVALKACGLVNGIVRKES